MVAQETNASLPGCLCLPPAAYLSPTALIRGGSGFGAMSSPPRASRTTPTGGSRKEICDGRQNFGRICGRGEVFQCDRAGVTGYAQPLLRELLRARKVCQRCLAASFCLTS